MNKAFYMVVALPNLYHAANGQNHFGLKAGINPANQIKTVSIPQVPSTTRHTRPFIGYQMGFFYKAGLHNRFALSAEANFSVIGSGITLMTADRKGYPVHEKLGYVEVPLIIQYKTGTVYLGAGPGAACIVFSKITHFE